MPAVAYPVSTSFPPHFHLHLHPGSFPLSIHSGFICQWSSTDRLCDSLWICSIVVAANGIGLLLFLSSRPQRARPNEVPLVPAVPFRSIVSVIVISKFLMRYLKAHQGTSLFTSASTNQREIFQEGARSREAQVRFPEYCRRGQSIYSC